jgi:hypothetical protein
MNLRPVMDDPQALVPILHGAVLAAAIARGSVVVVALILLRNVPIATDCYKSGAEEMH